MTLVLCVGAERNKALNNGAAKSSTTTTTTTTTTSTTKAMSAGKKSSKPVIEEEEKPSAETVEFALTVVRKRVCLFRRDNCIVSILNHVHVISVKEVSARAFDCLCVFFFVREAFKAAMTSAVP